MIPKNPKARYWAKVIPRLDQAPEPFEVFYAKDMEQPFLSRGSHVKLNHFDVLIEGESESELKRCPWFYKITMVDRRKNRMRKFTVKVGDFNLLNEKNPAISLGELAECMRIIKSIRGY